MNHKRFHEEGLEVAPSRNGGLETARDGLEIPEWSPGLQPDQTQRKRHSNSKPPKRICGMASSTFWLCLIILLLIVAIAAIGGGLGATKSSHSSTSAATLSPAATRATSSTVPTTSLASPASSSTSCTNNGTTYTASTGSTFQKFCNTDFAVGSNSSASIVWWWDGVNSFSACLDACALWNVWGIEGGPCQSATWSSLGSDQGTCWFKNATGLVNGTNGAYLPNHPARQSANLLVE